MAPSSAPAQGAAAAAASAPSEPPQPEEEDTGNGLSTPDLFGDEDYDEVPDVPVKAPDGQAPETPPGGAKDVEPMAANPVSQGSTGTSVSGVQPGAAPAGADAGADAHVGSQFVDESRYMRDADGNMLHKWKVDYASRAGGGRAMCRNTECLERHEQAGVRAIEKGSLRIGRRVLMESEGAVMIMWYHARCIFHSFTKSRSSTRIIQAEADLEGFESIQPEDQKTLSGIIAGSEDLRKAKFRSSEGANAARATPQKRPAVGAPGFDPGDGGAAWKKDRKGPAEQLLSVGDRVWIHCRVRPAATPDRPAAAPMDAAAIKSPKPELGIIREEPKDDSVIVQFESAEHERERIEKFNDKHFTRVRSWLKYPRVFEGKKQRLPTKWIQFKRAPPKLCGCSKQSWNHQCGCGIVCSRGTTTKVFGVCQSWDG